jgi:predicted ATPase/class 3 adenylate cyclase
MHCAACGADNSGEARFCANCGAPLTGGSCQCGADLPANAHFCPACGQATKRDKIVSREPPRLPPVERKQVTVLFADFAGYTAFVHKQDVEDVRDFMSSVWDRLDGIIAAHGGITEKHIGDAIMATFGARHAREEDPIQAVRAALAMQACLGEFQSSPNQARLQMRVGIHTGLAVVGPLGQTGEFAATGDTVNVANRLEQNAPLGGVLISHDTYRHVYGLFDMQGMLPLEVKGKPEPLPAYRVLGAKPRALATQLRGVEGVQTEMIGREAELKRLQSAMESVLEERISQVFTMVGEAGIGKSCLLREFQRWVELLPQTIRLFWGRATAEMRGLPFALVRDMFSARFEIQDNDPPAVAREKLERGLVDLLAAGGAALEDPGQEPVLQAHFIGHLLGLDYSASPFLRDILKDPDQIRRRAFSYLTHFFMATSQGSALASGRAPCQATMLVAEDIHCSDDASLDLLDHLARSCQHAPLLVICLARPTLFERRPAWGEGLPIHARLTLEPLSRRESRALVENILRKTAEIPQALRELIVGGAEGIPFFIEEIVKMLIDQKVILPGPEQWRIEPARLAAARVPPTLTGVLQARLDGLTSAERSVLQRASVVGRVFWDSAVERLGAADPQTASAQAEGTLSRPELLEALADLRRKELIFRRESSAFAGAVEYTFKHELLRSVTYESLLKKLRRDHHAQTAAWLIEQSGERINEFAGLVAFHLEQAGQSAQAADWYGRAGEQARRSYATATAIDYFRKALDLLPPDLAQQKQFQQKRMEWHEGLGEAMGAQARFAEALECFETLRLLAETLGDLNAQARAWNGLAFLHERLGKNRASIEAAERAEALARQAGELGRGERIRALHLKGLALYRLGDAPAVMALADETTKLCTEFGNRQGLATSFKLHGVARLQLGHYSEADRFFEQGLTLSRELGDRRTTAAMCSNLGESARLRGDYQTAADLYQRALAIAREIAHRESEIIYLCNLSAARLGLRQFEQVEADVQESIKLAAGSKSGVLTEACTILCEACLAQGKLAPALQAARRAVALAQESENDLDLGTAWRSLGQVVAARQIAGQPPMGGTDGPPHVNDAADCFTESLRVFKKMNAHGEQARTLRAWAEFELRQGRFNDGRKKGHEARSIFLQLGAAAEVARTDALLAA